MALIEIEDTQLEQLRTAGIPVRDRTADLTRAQTYETLMQRAANDPKQRDTVLGLLEANGAYVPELARVREAKTEITSMLDEKLKPFNEYLEGQKKREEEGKTKSLEKLLGDGRSYLRQQGWDDEGVERVENFMRTNSVGSYEIASDYLKKQNPDPNPLPTTAWGGGDFGNQWFHAPDDQPDHKLLLENPQAFSQQEVRKFFAEKQAGRQKY